MLFRCDGDAGRSGSVLRRARDTADSNDEDRRQIVEDRIDVLSISPTYREQSNGCVCAAAAPVQVSWIGYPATTASS